MKGRNFLRESTTAGLSPAPDIYEHLLSILIQSSLILMPHKKPKRNVFMQPLLLHHIFKEFHFLVSMTTFNLSWICRTVAVKISSDQHNKIVAFIFIRLAELLEKLQEVGNHFKVSNKNFSNSILEDENFYGNQ